MDWMLIAPRSKFQPQHVHDMPGLSRLELRAKGDTNDLYTNLVVVILALGALWLPLMHYLVDRKGYAVTLFVINTLGVVCSGLQACIPCLSHSDLAPLYARHTAITRLKVSAVRSQCQVPTPVVSIAFAYTAVGA